MKKANDITLLFFLFLMLIFSGSGVAVVQCLHAQTSQLPCCMEAEASCCAENPGSEDEQVPCMGLTVEKLASSLAAENWSFDFSTYPHAVLEESVGSYWKSLIPNIDNSQFIVDDEVFIPPRAYLSLNCAFLI